MKARIALILILLAPVVAFSQSAAAPAIWKGTHYTVTSWAGAEAGKVTGEIMEALLQRYNALFLFDLTKVATPWNVTLYPSREDCLKALEGQISVAPLDYIYLQYADPTRSQLVAWIPAPGSPVDEVRSLAYQGFFQYLWTFVPHAPAWIQTGLASVFWNSHWDGKTVSASSDWPFLDALQKKWNEKRPDLKILLGAKEDEVSPATGLDLEAWGLATFLLESSDPTYARFFGSALANLSPTATEEFNTQAVLHRFESIKDWASAGTDVQTWWKGKVSFSNRLALGTTQLKEKNFTGAAATFQIALALRPDDSAALYYAGLAAYESKDYGAAESFFAKVDGKVLPAGLLAYARGLTAFSAKQNELAKKWLNQAKAEDETSYAKLVAPVLDLIR